MITRSGSNVLSGGFRVNVSNPSWSAETPIEKSAGTSRASKLSPTFEVTAGGPIKRDRIWFFGGARAERTTTQSAFAQTDIPFTTSNENTRYEGKVTATLRPGHTLQGTVIDNRTNLRQPSLAPASIPRRSRRRRRPIGLWRRTGGACLVRAHLPKRSSRKRPGSSRMRAARAPRLSTHLSDPRRVGRAGQPAVQRPVLRFQRSRGAQQSAVHGQRVAHGLVAARRHPRGQERVRILHLDPRRRELAEPERLRLPDRLQDRRRWPARARCERAADPAVRARHVPSPDVDAAARILDRRHDGLVLRERSLDCRAHDSLRSGARYERGTQQGDRRHLGRDGNTLVPRLGAAYDLTADGRTVAQATYGHYAGRYNDVQFSRNSNVGQCRPDHRRRTWDPREKVASLRRGSTRQITRPSPARSRPRTCFLTTTCSRR